MYICNCNGLNEKKVHKAVEKGASHPKHVFRMNNCKPKCAKCICEMRDIINNTSQAMKIAAE